MKHQQVKAFTAQETDQLAQIHIHYLLLELHLDMTTNSSQTATSLKTSANTEYEISSNKNILTINNKVYNTATYASFSASYNMTLMASTVGGTGLANYLNGRMYYCKIYDNDLLIRDLVPCYRKSDNKPGLYDIVNNVFYTNAGTGEFAVGPNV